MYSTNRKLLTLATAAFISIGLLVFIYVLLSSLEVSNSEIDKRPHISIEKLNTGDTIKLQIANHVILVTKNDTGYSVVSFPGRDGVVYMPEFNWGRPALPCKNFIQPDGFQCFDKNQHQDGIVWWNYMKWDKSGKYIGENKQNTSIPDLLTPKYKITGNYIVILQL